MYFQLKYFRLVRLLHLEFLLLEYRNNCFDHMCQVDYHFAQILQVVRFSRLLSRYHFELFLLDDCVFYLFKFD
jgi:hypothetical protein